MWGFGDSSGPIEHFGVRKMWNQITVITLTDCMTFGLLGGYLSLLNLHSLFSLLVNLWCDYGGQALQA